MSSEIKDSLVLFKTRQGAVYRATLLRLTRYLVAFENYDPDIVLRASEVLNDCRILIQDRTVYSGRGVVRNQLGVGLKTICEVTLDEAAWIDLTPASEWVRNGRLGGEFGQFIQEWQRTYKVRSDYKVIIADMHSFLSELRLFLDQVELSVKAAVLREQSKLEEEACEQLSHRVTTCVNALFERFEAIAQELDEALRPAHQNYMRRHLHPLVLCAPFANRTYHKPLGYAGDYEMVNMIVRNRHEGESLYAKVVNTWFLRQPPAEAHRNRVDYLAKVLSEETLRACRMHRPIRIFNMACGPAREVQKLISESPLSDQLRLTMLDFNEETLQYVRSTLDDLKNRHGRLFSVEYLKKSVHQILKESGSSKAAERRNGYDVVYCAGLFDYLSNPVCHRLMNLMYEWLSPGGLLLVTNVEPSNPLRNGMEHLLDWHLIYRTAQELRHLLPTKADQDVCCVRTDSTGVNLMLEVRKPDHA